MDTFTIKKEVQITASLERVFSALTNSDEIPQYFPLKAVESDWLVGSEVLYRGEVNGDPFTDYGVIEILSPPTTYKYRYWSDNHGFDRVAENYLTISYALENSADGTLLTVVQRNIQSLELYELMNHQVWDFLLGSLKKYVETHT
ncbi:MAG: hypothetical protein ACI9WC_001318 [Arenicella sp.]|jgi:uncharacterized protein YndB with AHSA1/START domain